MLLFGSTALYRLRWGGRWGRERILRRHEALQRRRAMAVRCRHPGIPAGQRPPSAPGAPGSQALARRPVR